MELLCDGHGLLSESGVGDEQYFVGSDGLAEADKFLNHIFVDLESSCGIDDNDVVMVEFGLIYGVGGDLGHVHISAFGIDGYADLVTEELQLIDSGGAVYVGGGHKDAFALFFQHFSEFSAGSGFAAAVETDHHDNGWRAGEIEFCLLGTE